MRLYLQSQNKREFSSAGSEHLPYKQRVTGSNPVTPTKSLIEISGFFVFLIIYKVSSGILILLYLRKNYLWLINK